MRCVLGTCIALALISTLGASERAVEQAVEESIALRLDEIVSAVRREVESQWQEKFDRYKQETDARLAQLEQKSKLNHSRSRRDLNGLLFFTPR